MRWTVLAISMFAAVALACTAQLSADSAHSSDLAAARSETDPISGDWKVAFELEGMTTPGTMTLKLDGERVTGTLYSDHTGPGTLSNGSYVDNKLSFRADFEKHESIEITGSVKDGKLIGEFRTEGRQGTWEATKK